MVSTAKSQKFSLTILDNLKTKFPENKDTGFKEKKIDSYSLKVFFFFHKNYQNLLLSWKKIYSINIIPEPSK